VHGFVRNCRGSILLESVVGEGTAVHVHFPVHQGISAPVFEEQEAVPKGSEHIFFIDDETVLTEIGSVMLARLGYKVTVSNSSMEALGKFQNQPDQYDLIITDQTMPDMTGAELAHQMLQIRPDIPVILSTGYSSIMTEKKSKEIGIKEYLLKPLTTKDLGAAVRRVLDRNLSE